MTSYKIIPLENEKFGLQRAGSNEVRGQFDSRAEAAIAGGIAGAADTYRPE